MKPPSGGPTIGPTSAGIVTHESACTISAFGIVRSSTSRPTGTIIAPPMPCTNRPATSAPSESLSAQPTEPSRNTAIADTNVARAPKRSATQPLTGMKTASASRYVVNASFSAIGSVARSTAIAGSDVESTVESMFSTNRAQATIRGRRREDFMAKVCGAARNRPLRPTGRRNELVSRPRSVP